MIIEEETQPQVTSSIGTREVGYFCPVPLQDIHLVVPTPDPLQLRQLEFGFPVF